MYSVLKISYKDNKLVFIKNFKSEETANEYYEFIKIRSYVEIENNSDGSTLREFEGSKNVIKRFRVCNRKDKINYVVYLLDNSKID